MSLENIHLEILQLLLDNVPKDFSDVGDISRKILFKSVNFKPKQIEKACDELESRGFVQFHAGFFKKAWSSISITDEGIDIMEPEDDWDENPQTLPE
jgi:predicted transcriptional regulator